MAEGAADGEADSDGGGACVGASVGVVAAEGGGVGEDDPLHAAIRMARSGTTTKRFTSRSPQIKKMARPEGFEPPTY